jgi:hypothetical protein
MGIFRCNEAALAAMRFEKEFLFDTIMNMEDPQFLIRGKWYLLGREFQSLVARFEGPDGKREHLKATAEWTDRPTAVRDGDDGAVILLEVRHYLPMLVQLKYSEVSMLMDGLDALTEHLDTRGVLAKLTLIKVLSKLLPPEEFGEPTSQS